MSTTPHWHQQPGKLHLHPQLLTWHLSAAARAVTLKGPRSDIDAAGIAAGLGPAPLLCTCQHALQPHIGSGTLIACAPASAHATGKPSPQWLALNGDEESAGAAMRRRLEAHPCERRMWRIYSLGKPVKHARGAVAWGCMEKVAEARCRQEVLMWAGGLAYGPRDA